MRSVAALGVAALAVLCCAGVPLIVALVGGLTVAGILGVGGGVLVASGLAAGAVVVLRARPAAGVRGAAVDEGGRHMKLELLYFDGCPNHEAFLPRLRALLDREGIEEQVRLRRVESPEAAERERFLGSPTLRVDGRDVDPGAAQRTDYGLKCRLYRTAAGTSGTPADEWVLQALKVGDAAADRD